MKTRAYAVSTTIAAVLAITLLALICCCAWSFALFGLGLDNNQGTLDNGTLIVVLTFTCCGFSLPAAPLTIWGISYFFASRTEKDVEQNLYEIYSPDARK